MTECLVKMSITNAHHRWLRLTLISAVFCSVVMLASNDVAAQNSPRQAALGTPGFDDTPQATSVQSVYPDPEQTEVVPGGAWFFEVKYDTEPQDETLTGIGIRVHYDSTKVSFDKVSETLEFGRLFNPVLIEPQEDSGDLDGDPATDFFISMAWVDFGGNWPGQLPEKLAKVHFFAAVDFTGFTIVRFSASDLAAGYEFLMEPAILAEPNIFIDGFE